MGALHEGHLELVRRAERENGISVCSIFVNPIQFNNPEDLKKYPREETSDVDKLQEAGCGMVFIPTVEEMYPEPETTVFDFGQLDKVMEGKFRPGHFNGVAVVVKKLFDVTTPDRAYFGEKDFQQLVIIRRLVEMLELSVEVIPCPTIRESDGLAMSSRNKRLNEEDRKRAPLIYAILCEAKARAGKHTVKEVTDWVHQEFNKYPFFELEYFEITDMNTLQPVISWDESPGVVACAAVYLGGVRLIDNIKIIS
jgi:pantoate--beta-alanine ligase